MGNAIRHISPARRTNPGRSSELAVVIPAAGIGRRMKSKVVKSLVEFNGQAIIEKQIIDVWSQFPKAEIFVVVGYQSDKVRNYLKNYPIRFIYNPIFETSNVAFSISLALQATISSQILLIYGDLIFNKESISHIASGKSKILIDSAKLFNSDEVGFGLDENGRIANFSYGLPDKWAQIAYLAGRELDLFKEICYNEDAIRWFGYEALNEVINLGGRIESHDIKTAKIIDVDTPQDLQKASKIF